MSNIIDFEEIKKMGVSKEAIEEFIDILKTIKETVEENKDKSVEYVNQLISSQYNKISNWNEKYKIDKKKLKKILDKIPDDIKRGFNVKVIPIGSESDLSGILGKVMQVEEVTTCVLDNDKNIAKIYFEEDKAIIVSPRAIDLKDNELNSLIYAYEENFKQVNKNVPKDFSVDIIACENTTIYRKKSKRVKE